MPITRYWLIPTAKQPKMFTPHPSMSSAEISERTQKVWDRFYEWQAGWKRPEWGLSYVAPKVMTESAFHVLPS